MSSRGRPVPGGKASDTVRPILKGGGDYDVSLHAVFRTSLDICATLTTLSASRMTSDRLRIADPAGDAFRLRGSDNWRTFVRTGANMLIVGPRCALDAFMQAAEAELAQPLRYVRPLVE